MISKESVIAKICFVLGLVVLITFVLSFVLPVRSVGMMPILLIIGFFYVPYKINYKKEHLSNREWVIVGSLILLFFAGLYINIFLSSISPP